MHLIWKTSKTHITEGGVQISNTNTRKRTRKRQKTNIKESTASKRQRKITSGYLNRFKTSLPHIRVKVSQLCLTNNDYQTVWSTSPNFIDVTFGSKLFCLCYEKAINRKNAETLFVFSAYTLLKANKHAY